MLSLVLNLAYLLSQSNQLIVLRDAVAPSGASHFDVSRSQRDSQVAHRSIFGFSGAMRDTKGESGLASSLRGLESTRDGADLIQFEENTGRQSRFDVGAVG